MDMQQYGQWPDMLVEGSGNSSAPGVPVPPPTCEDMQRDALADYDPNLDDLASCWIRRAVHAEAFAAALEADLTKLRGPC